MQLRQLRLHNYGYKQGCRVGEIFSDCGSTYSKFYNSTNSSYLKFYDSGSRTSAKTTSTPGCLKKRFQLTTLLKSKKRLQLSPETCDSDSTTLVRSHTFKNLYAIYYHHLTSSIIFIYAPDSE